MKAIVFNASDKYMTKISEVTKNLKIGTYSSNLDLMEYLISTNSKEGCKGLGHDGTFNFHKLKGGL